MLTKEQKKVLKLKGSSPSFPICLMIGKGGIGDSQTAVLDKALTAHELAKVKVQAEDASEMKEAAAYLEKATKSELVEIRGHTALYYRKNEKNPKLFPKG